MPVQPIILLAFSNNADAYLPMIVAEQKAIKQALFLSSGEHKEKKMSPCWLAGRRQPAR